MCLVDFLFYFMFLNKINKIKLYVKKIYILFDIIIVIKIIKNTSFLYNILIFVKRIRPLLIMEYTQRMSIHLHSFGDINNKKNPIRLFEISLIKH